MMVLYIRQKWADFEHVSKNMCLILDSGTRSNKITQLHTFKDTSKLFNIMLICCTSHFRSFVKSRNKYPITLSSTTQISNIPFLKHLSLSYASWSNWLRLSAEQNVSSNMRAYFHCLAINMNLP